MPISNNVVFERWSDDDFHQPLKAGGVRVLTLFTTPKPFTGHIEVIQRNAITSWTRLSDEVQVLLIGDEPGMDRIAQDLDVTHLPEISLNSYGTPRLDSIFSSARKHARHPWLCYVNADIILMDDLVPTVNRITQQFERFLIVGQRWDLDIQENLDFGDGWQSRLRENVSTAGSLHPPAGSDYFIFPKDEFAHMPPFALGRAGWDNWMIFAGRQSRIPVIDASQAITLVHQNHDYGHLPGAQPHYRLPESEENVRMAGGKPTIFTLLDADWMIDSQSIFPLRVWDGPIIRRIEAGWITRVGPGKAAWLVRRLFRPVDTLKYYWRAFFRRLGQVFQSKLGS